MISTLSRCQGFAFLTHKESQQTHSLILQTLKNIHKLDLNKWECPKARPSKLKTAKQRDIQKEFRLLHTPSNNKQPTKQPTKQTSTRRKKKITAWSVLSTLSKNISQFKKKKKHLNPANKIENTTAALPKKKPVPLKLLQDSINSDNGISFFEAPGSPFLCCRAEFKGLGPLSDPLRSHPPSQKLYIFEKS